MSNRVSVRSLYTEHVISQFDDHAYSSNYFNYINISNPDTSGMLRFVTDELQDAEDAGDRGSSLFDLYPSLIIYFFQSGSLDMSLAAGMVLTVW